MVPQTFTASSEQLVQTLFLEGLSQALKFSCTPDQPPKNAGPPQCRRLRGLTRHHKWPGGWQCSCPPLYPIQLLCVFSQMWVDFLVYHADNFIGSTREEPPSPPNSNEEKPEKTERLIRQHCPLHFSIPYHLPALLQGFGLSFAAVCSAT